MKRIRSPTKNLIAECISYAIERERNLPVAFLISKKTGEKDKWK